MYRHMHRSMVISAGLCALLVSSSRAQAPQAAQAATRAALDVEVPSVVGRSLRRGHSNPNRVLHISISLNPTDAAGLQAYADGVSDPASPFYRQFLTPEQVGAQFGAPEAAVGQLTDYLKGQGFTIRLVAKNHLAVLADSTVTKAEAAFATRIDDFSAINPNHEAGNPNFFSFSRPLSVPTPLKPLILDVSGLENFTRPQFRALTPQQTWVLYNEAPIYNAGMRGEGRTVGISNWDGFRLSNVPLYYSKYGLPTPPGGAGSNITVIPISGGAGSGTPGAEGDLDIQMVLGMAPLCNLRVYDGGSNDLIGVLTAEVNDNLADVISESYGWSLSASTASAAHNLHLSMTAQGITYMAASGDSGTTLEPYSYPNYDPEVLMVGGTVASVDSAGNRLSETGWSGSGGGWSTNTATFNTLPSWQKGTGVPTAINRRLSPDVSLHSSSSTGAYYFYFRGALTSGYVGTSFASPVFAGSLAVAEQKIIAQGGLPANSAGKRRLGRLQDLVYAQNGRSDVWLDILTGSNGKLPDGSTSNAGAGWDFVTGWGPINWDKFVATQVAPVADFNVTGSPSSQTVTQGNSAAYTTTVTAFNGFTGQVDLSVTGVPTGANATFNPASVTGSGASTLTVSTTSTTAAGTYTLTIKGTSGSLTHTAAVTLVVSAVAQGDFSLSANPTSIALNRRNSPTGTSAVTVSPTGGFADDVNLTIAGLPAGITAAFSPPTVTGGSGASTLKLTARSSGPTGTFGLTLTGTDGRTGQVHSTPISLTVTK